MKNKKMIWFIVLGLIVLGLLCVLIGFSTGTKEGVYWNKTGIHIIEGKKQEQKNLNLEQIKQISISSENFKVVLEEADTYGIEIQSYDEQKVEWHMQDGILTINEKKEDNFRLLSLDFGFLNLDKTSYIKVLLPKDANLDQVVIDQKNGSVEASNLTAKEIKIQNKYGRVHLEQIHGNTLNLILNDGSFYGKAITCDQIELTNKYGRTDFEEITNQFLHIQSSDGSISLTNLHSEEVSIYNKYGQVIAENVEFGKSKIETKDGAIRLSGDFTGQTDIFSKYGRVVLNLKKDPSYYCLDLKTKYGNIVLDGKNQKDQTTYQTTPENGKMMNVETEDGSMEINFNS